MKLLRKIGNGVREALRAIDSANPLRMRLICLQADIAFIEASHLPQPTAIEVMEVANGISEWRWRSSEEFLRERLAEIRSRA